MKRAHFAIAAVAASALALSLFAITPTQATEESSVQSVLRSLSRAPQDNLIYVSPTPPRVLDPALIDDGDSSNIAYNIYEGLVKFKKGSTQIEPALAKSWDVSSDGKVYTFHLREGVKFTDGTPFNAQAVKINYDRQLPGKATAQMVYARLVFAHVKSVDVVDDNTVRITLDKAYTPFLKNMAMRFAAPIASPKVIENDVNSLSTNPVGTGPYKLVTWDRDEQVVLTRNPDYWGPKPPIENVYYRQIRDQSSRILALNNGEADVLEGLAPSDIGAVKKGGNEIYEAFGLNTQYVAINQNKGSTLHDPALRRAVAQAINIPDLTKNLYRGNADYAATFIPKGILGFDAKAKGVAYDPKAAKAAFDKAGVHSLTIYAGTSPSISNIIGGQPVAEAIQAYLKAVGVTATIQSYPAGAYEEAVQHGGWDLAIKGWTSDNGDPDNFLSIFAANDIANNPGGYQNAEFTKLLAEGAITPNGNKRAQIYEKADELLVQKDVGVIPLYHSRDLVGHNPKVQGELVHPMINPFFNRITKQP